VGLGPRFPEALSPLGNGDVDPRAASVFAVFEIAKSARCYLLTVRELEPSRILAFIRGLRI